MEMALALIQPDKADRADKAEKPKQKTVSTFLKATQTMNRYSIISLK